VENDSRPCVVVTAWPADRPAAPLVQVLVERRLAACVHVAPAGTSTYWWEGAVESAAEQQLLIKTVRRCLPALEAAVRSMHPYALPEWLVVDVDGSPAYLGWMAASVAGSDPA